MNQIDRASDLTVAQPRSSVLYALGKLAAETQAHKETLDGLPARIVDMLSPRLGALEAAHTEHKLRLARVEEKQWLLLGGLTLLSVGTPIVFTLIKG